MCNKVIAFDLDDVLCYRTSEEGAIKKYHSCQPILKMINIVNQCHQEGFKIIIYTSRGMTTCQGNVSNIYSSLYQLTLSQLHQWEVKFDQLIMGKVHYDLLIDDKAKNSSEINSIQDIRKFFD